MEAARSVFGAGAASANMPSTELAETDFSDGQISVIDLVIRTGLVSSRGEARRLIEQGGLAIDDEKVADIGRIISDSAFEKGYVVIKKGKKVFHKVIFTR